jgi:hypothetical protein
LPVKAFSVPPTSEMNSENSRAVAVPDHVGDDGSAMIGNDHDVEAVGQGEIHDVRRGRRGRRHRGPIETDEVPPERPPSGAIVTISRHIDCL